MGTVKILDSHDENSQETSIRMLNTTIMEPRPCWREVNVPLFIVASRMQANRLTPCGPLGASHFHRLGEVSQMNPPRGRGRDALLQRSVQLAAAREAKSCEGDANQSERRGFGNRDGNVNCSENKIDALRCRSRVLGLQRSPLVCPWIGRWIAGKTCRSRELGYR